MVHQLNRYLQRFLLVIWLNVVFGWSEWVGAFCIIATIVILSRLDEKVDREQKVKSQIRQHDIQMSMTHKKEETLDPTSPPFTIDLNNSLRNHSIGYFYEASDIGTDNKITWSIIRFCSFYTVSVNIDHDVL